MAKQMTRAEYEAAYGSSPVISTSTIDTTPAPIRMTRDEYNATYRAKPQSFFQDFKQDIAETRQGQQSALNRGLEAESGISKRASLGEVSPLKSMFQRFGTGLGTAGNIIGETVIGAGKAILPQSVEQRIADTLGKDIEALFSPESREKFIKSLEDSKGGIFIPKELDQSAAKFLRDAGEAYRNDPNFRADADAAGGILQWLALPEGAARVTKTAVDTAGSAAKRIDVAPLVKRVTQSSDETLTANRAAALADIENKYASLRKLNDFSPDAGAESRNRISRTNVLADAVDEDGLIRTKGPGGAVEQYRMLTIDGVEDVVKRNLEREGAFVSVPEITNRLRTSIADSGLEGGDLVAALKGLDREIKGLSLRMDELGRIPLSKLQDAKISTTRNINFNTPPETATYRKAIARAYKEIIERKSNFNVREVNAELAKFYKDIERLEALDGKRVKGGRLGKYFAQISGNIVGGAAGSAVGGPIGTALGTIAGGEAASFIAGKSMSRAFGRGGVLPEKNPILAQARINAGLPPGRDLTIPDPVVGIPAKTKAQIEKLATPAQKKEIAKIERQMSDNVKQQKKAVSEKDYTLVDSLKKVYDALVVRLKDLVNEIIESAKNPSIGLSIKATVTPEKVAKAMDFEDFQNVMTFLEDPQASLLNDKLIRMTDEMGIGNADLDTQVKFLREVTDEAEQLGILQLNNLGKRNTQYQATNNTNSNVITDTVDDVDGNVQATGVDSGATPQTTTLLEEARKYKSAEEFERALLNNSNVSKNPRFQEIDIRKIIGTDYPELDEALKSGRKMTVDEIEQIIQPTDEFIEGQSVVWPIEVSKNSDGTFQLYAGNHRLAQKIINGDFKILANVTNDKSGKTIKEIWEESQSN